MPSDPAAEVRLPKKDAATRLLVGDEKLAALLEAAGRQGSDFRCVRDRAVLAVLTFCGLRRQELLDLRTGALNLADRSLLVQQGKGRKARTVFLCDDALAALREWNGVRSGLRGGYELGVGRGSIRIWLPRPPVKVTPAMFPTKNGRSLHPI